MPPKRPRLCVIGSINIDCVLRTKRFARPGETLPAESWTTSPGGKGANQAVAAARLGANIQFGGRIGSDAFGGSLLETLKAEGVDVAEVKSTLQTPTGMAVILVDHSGQNSIYLLGGANQSITPSDVDSWEGLIRESSGMLLQLEIPLEATLQSQALARKRGISIFLDPAPAPAAPFPESLLEVDLISPNESETEALTGISLTSMQLVRLAAFDLQKRGAKQVVIKLGGRGAFALARNGDMAHLGAAQVAVVDTTAAGDAFSAALAVSLIQGEDLFSAARFACAAGALAVTRAGAQPAMPTLGEVQLLLKQQSLPITLLGNSATLADT